MKEMKKSNNPILNAVLSKLIADRDEYLVRLDLIINKNQSNSGVSGMVSEAYSLTKELASIEITIDWIYGLLENNNSDSETILNKIKELQETLKTTENNNNNDNNGNNS